MATVVCFRWFDAFPASYVTVLRNAVRANLSREHRFVCITDNPDGLDASIESLPLPEMGIPDYHKRHGCWPKVAMFKAGLLEPDDPTLFLDLDIVIRESLDPFFDRLEQRRGLQALREWNPTLWSLLPLSMRPHRGVQSSIVGFYPGEQACVYDRFMANQQAEFSRFPNDQTYLTSAAANLEYWPYEWTASFKRHCVKYYPLSKLMPQIKEPRKAKIVVFHGDPRPVDVVPMGNYKWGPKRRCGFGPVDWVRDYWLQHDKTWTDAPVSEAAQRRAA